jgi:ATP-dependent protease ClpP protease subunit
MSSYTIPNVIAQHPRGERIMDVYSHLLTERIVYLGTAVDPGVANALHAAGVRALPARAVRQAMAPEAVVAAGDLAATE